MKKHFITSILSVLTLSFLDASDPTDEPSSAATGGGRQHKPSYVMCRVLGDVPSGHLPFRGTPEELERKLAYYRPAVDFILADPSVPYAPARRRPRTEVLGEVLMTSISAFLPVTSSEFELLSPHLTRSAKRHLPTCEAIEFWEGVSAAPQFPRQEPKLRKLSTEVLPLISPLYASPGVIIDLSEPYSLWLHTERFLEAYPSIDRAKLWDVYRGATGISTLVDRKADRARFIAVAPHLRCSYLDMHGLTGALEELQETLSAIPRSVKLLDLSLWPTGIRETDAIRALTLPPSVTHLRLKRFPGGYPNPATPFMGIDCLVEGNFLRHVRTLWIEDDHPHITFASPPMLDAARARFAAHTDRRPLLKRVMFGPHNVLGK